MQCGVKYFSGVVICLLICGTPNKQRARSTFFRLEKRDKMVEINEVVSDSEDCYQRFRHFLY